MWIRTQNEAALYDVIAVRAVRMISEKSYSVTGLLQGSTESVVLGEYADYASAQAELEKMEPFLTGKSVYHMTK